MGLNINQTNFENLPKASSLAQICKTTFDKEKILLTIMEKLESTIKNLEFDVRSLWESYNGLLFKKGVPMPFKDQSDKNFMGIIQGVSTCWSIAIVARR